VVANLPYAISSAWMEGLLGSGKLPTSMVMMLQKEATERMLASPGTKAYNALAIFLQSAYQQAGYHPVPGQCFYPAPTVASALLKMEKKTGPYLFAKETRSLIRRIFTQRRKQIGSLLKKEEQKIQQIMTSWLEENNICSTTRPEKISVDQWIKLGRKFPSTK
jgi:16S rRNA (adenine1518-N6/adenine1519-N6)-dimethyltransferase